MIGRAEPPSCSSAIASVRRGSRSTRISRCSATSRRAASNRSRKSAEHDTRPEGSPTVTEPTGPLAGRTALITGSGQNIGRAIALAFARLGANVVVNGHRNQAAIDGVAAEARALGVGALAALADVADATAVKAMVEQATTVFGGVDISVSNASLRLHTPFLDISLEEWHRIIESNLNASFYLARAVIPGMKQR